MSKYLYRGVDISQFNGSVDFTALKKSGVDFVIIRLAGVNGGGIYKDKKCDVNYAGAMASGLHVGFYYCGNDGDFNFKNYTYRVKKIKEWLSDYVFDMPFFYDVEGNILYKHNKKELTDHIKNFCFDIERAGYFVGIYMSMNPFNTCVYNHELDHFTRWVARYSDKQPDLKGCKWDMWQKTDKHPLCGKKFDLDFCYKDYPTIIKNVLLNNYK